MAPSAADRCRLSLRKLYKAHMQIGYGESSRSIESMIKATTRQAFHHLDEEEVNLVLAGGVPPWLDTVAKDFLFKGTPLPAGRALKDIVVDAADAAPDVAPHVAPDVAPDLDPAVEPAELAADAAPEVPAPKRPAKWYAASRAFDYFCYLEKDALTAKAKQLMKSKLYASRPLAAVIKVAGSQCWRKLRPDEKLAHRRRAEAVAGRRSRSADGRLIREVCDEVDVEPALDDEDFDTPKKKKLSTKHASTLGHGLVDELAVVMSQIGTPEKQFAERLLVRATSSAPKVIKSLKKMGVTFRKVRKPKLGRPNGTTKVSDAQLIERLHAVSSDTSNIHNTLQTPIRTLEMSKRRCAKVAGLSKSQLALRLKNCRLGFADGKTARGKCDACLAWKQTGRNRLTHLLDDTMARMRALLPNYFVAWDMTVELEYLDAYELPSCENPDYITKLVEYLENHQHDYSDDRVPLEDEKQIALITFELEFIEGLVASLEDVQNMAWHFSLKRTVEMLWKEAWYQPSQYTLYGLWDHMASRLIYLLIVYFL
jgi:hypothetical protein